MPQSQSLRNYNYFLKRTSLIWRLTLELSRLFQLFAGDQADGGRRSPYFYYSNISSLFQYVYYQIEALSNNKIFLSKSMKSSNQKRVFIIGVGMTKFLKPSEHNPQYDQLTQTAANRALQDCGLRYQNMEAVIAGYIYADATSAQRVAYRLGMTGIPIYNTNNNGATGSSTVHLSYNLVKGGIYQCVMAYGFQKMEKGALNINFPSRPHSMMKLCERSFELMGEQNPQPMAPRLFGNAGIQHMNKYGTKIQHFVKIAAKNYRNGSKNPYAQYQRAFSEQQIAKSPKVHGILTLYQCSPTTDGAACIIVCSQEFMKKNKLENQGVQILSSVLATDVEKVFENNIQLTGYSMVKNAAKKAFQLSKVLPQNIQVVELHDCFSTNELITYEALGLCQQGKGGEFVDKGLNDYGGQVVVNPSGGLISRGHPIGATGVSQFVELAWQLRGIAERRQVFNKQKKLPQYGLQHGIGLGGACVVSILQKYNQQKSRGTSDLVEKQKSQSIKMKIKAKL